MNDEQQQPDASQSLANSMGILDMIRGGGGAGGMGNFGIIGAIIAAQMMMTDANPRKINGRGARDARTGGMMTEPWLDYVGARAGWDATPGAKFDAGEKGAGKAAVDYWTDPARGAVRYAGENTIGKKATNVIDPVGGVMAKSDVANPIGWLAGKLR